MSKNGKVALVYGSDTGSTEFVSDTIAVKLGIKDLVFRDISTMKISDFDDYSILILGIPTWYIGELQTDWDDFFSEFQKINFDNKKVAFYALGDQYGYPDNFVDGIGILAKVVLKK